MIALMFVGPDDAGVEELLVLRARLDARLAEELAVFDREGLWALDGSVSLAGWLRQRGVPRGAAGRQAALARKLTPGVAQAWREGVLDAGQVDVICTAVTEATRERWVEHEADVVPSLKGLSQV